MTTYVSSWRSSVGLLSKDYFQSMSNFHGIYQETIHFHNDCLQSRPFCCQCHYEPRITNDAYSNITSSRTFDYIYCTNFSNCSLILNTYVPISIVVFVNEIVSVLFLIHCILSIIQVTEGVRSEKIISVPTISSVSSIPRTVQEKFFASLDWSTSKTSINIFQITIYIYIYT